MTREEMYAKLDALYDHIDETKARAETAKTDSRERLEDHLDEARGRVAAAKENLRLTDERNKSKLNAQMLKLQMEVEQARDQRAAAKQEHDRKKALKAVEDLENYAADAIAVALIAVDEAAYASLEAIDARLSYEEASHDQP